MDAATFRAEYPEFADVSTYPDARVTRFITLAEALLPACRWADLLNEGLGLFTAHSLTVAARNAVKAGSIMAPMKSKQGDKLGASYDVESVTLADGGYWNQTSYGIQLLTWARIVGAGGVQL